MGVVRTQLGQLYEAAGSYKRARELCGGDRPLAPQITQWQNIVHNLVLVLLDLGHRKDAQVHARRAAEIAANDAEKWCVVSHHISRASRARAPPLDLDGTRPILPPYTCRAGTSTDLSHRHWPTSTRRRVGMSAPSRSIPATAVRTSTSSRRWRRRGTTAGTRA